MKRYITEQYNLAMTDYKLAKSEHERQVALREMHKLKLLASEKVGFEFSDSLGKGCIL